MDDTTWTAGDVLEALEKRNHSRGLFALPITQQRDPLALLAHQLHQINAGMTTPPRVARQRAHHRARMERAQERQAEQAWREKITAERSNPETQQRLADMHARRRAIFAQRRAKSFANRDRRPYLPPIHDA